MPVAWSVVMATRPVTPTALEAARPTRKGRAPTPRSAEGEVCNPTAAMATHSSGADKPEVCATAACQSVCVSPNRSMEGEANTASPALRRQAAPMLPAMGIRQSTAAARHARH